jgi:hypothetical protein
MSRLLFVIFCVFVCGAAMGQQLENDPVKMADPASPGRATRQPLPRDEIPGTIRHTQADDAFQLLEDYPTTDPDRNATDTASMYFLDEQGKPIRDLRQVYRRADPIPQMRRSRPADTLSYVPNVPRDTIPPVSTKNR